jgi:hypothetical protein
MIDRLRLTLDRDTGVQLQFQAGNGVFLNIHHNEGKSSMAKAAFQSESDFQDIHTTLLEKANG